MNYTCLVELYLVESDNRVHFSVVLCATWGDMEVQNSKTQVVLLFLIQNLINGNLVSQEYHLGRLYLLHVAHLDPLMHMGHEHALPGNYADNNQQSRKICIHHMHEKTTIS
jgi:hypothetical protein